MGLSVISFPNLHLRNVEHTSSVKEIENRRIDLLVTVSGDGTILRVLRTLDNLTPCLCVNVGGRGILSEIKPDQFRSAIENILKGKMYLEHRARIISVLGDQILPPALNEVNVVRQTVAHTPIFTIDFDNGAVFTQRMDGLLLSTPTGSTGHSFSYGGPFLEGTFEGLIVTPIGAINRFPIIIRNSSSQTRVMATYALHLIIDGQEVFNLEPDTFVVFKKHEKDAVFVRFDHAGPFRQLKNLGFS